jgi:hypothetical protein
MIRQLFYTGLVFALLVSTIKADAQEKLRKNETYCLEYGAGRSMPITLCRFETLEQCLASKTTNSDTCMINPAIGFRKRGY